MLLLLHTALNPIELFNLRCHTPPSISFAPPKPPPASPVSQKLQAAALEAWHAASVRNVTRRANLDAAPAVAVQSARAIRWRARRSVVLDSGSTVRIRRCGSQLRSNPGTAAAGIQPGTLCRRWQCACVATS
jgi:hypothetical protein